MSRSSASARWTPSPSPVSRPTSSASPPSATRCLPPSRRMAGRRCRRSRRTQSWGGVRATEEDEFVEDD
eukprot:13088312-Alexandrium_andersonii.AAC.1